MTDKQEALLLFSKSYTIRWQDLDAFNHVNHTNYLVYFQECRIDWLRHHGVFLNDSEKAPVVSEINCKYFRPITYPADIIVELYFAEQIGKRLIFDMKIINKDDREIIYTTGVVTVVWMSLTTGRGILPPEEYNHLLEQTIVCD